MSAAIHPFPPRGPHRRIGGQAHPERTDDLVAELAVAVGSRPVAAGQDLAAAIPAEPTRTSGGATVHVLRPRPEGANDLVLGEDGATVRRHVAVILAATLALVLAVAAVTGLLDRVGGAAVPIAGSTVVEGGETLWGIASDITPPDRDVRDTVALLLDVNDFSTPTISEGTVVLLPDLDG